ncbi:MAG: Rne/Rng family ribonuclease [Pseudomonadota bacterium]|nr:Rne/Rng family ribonuclease [Pseudomonadota bacterium]QKK05307.1 MAG: Rne/Rng family ribonuclease [Pseudomonadota bacterium]
MTRRMLIDATHKEETRVAIVAGDNRLEDFDYESASRKQLKGNIYLVKVTRVEPSLQAAFVDFGGNRHGFLPFPEIHPDYYRIPIEDRQELLEEEKRITEEHAAEIDAQAEAEAEEQERRASKKSGKKGDDNDHDEETGRGVQTVGGEDDEAEEEEIIPSQMKINIKRRYKIQEVIKRGQVMLIQINKEERGNKGAAVSTYISLPGRYCVLMPNSPRGGGVSRKVGNMKDRKKLKKILGDLDIPEGMSVILRTAGVERSKAEIKRDLDYLLKLWNDIRELTLQSTAPAMVHEEGNLIKRAVRDLYKRDLDEILVAGEEAYETAKKLMKSLIPSHARRVKLDKEETPLFARYNVEHQIDETYGTTVRLRSGGYLVINPTEALVSIDINSGKATKGRHIEETALKTNLEAAEEIARQLRLRDLGGLVVIDFIDMEENRNNRTVERKLKESMQGDRARIQISRISAFGLLELSRQRLRPSLVESNFMTCPHCAGSAVVRTVESASVMVLRHLEEALLRGKPKDMVVRVTPDVALYLLNQKRARLYDLETRYGINVTIESDHEVASHQDFTLEVIAASGKRLEVQMPQHAPLPPPPQNDRQQGNNNRRGDGDSSSQDEEGGGRKRSRGGRRGGRRRRGGRGRDNAQQQNENGQEENVKEDNNNQPGKEAETAQDTPETTEKPQKKAPARRRKPAAKKAESENTAAEVKDAPESQTADKEAEKAPAEEKPKTAAKAAPKKRAPRKKAAPKQTAAEKKADTEEKATGSNNDNIVVPLEKPEAAAPAKEEAQQGDTPPEKKKKGWWQKLKE